MPIETICQGCGKRLRVGDEHAGKAAKCPQCQTVYTVPQPASIAPMGAGLANASNLPPDDRWHLRTDGGLTFGPVSRRELDRWLTEGRINHSSQILHEREGNWIWAGQVYPQLAPLAVGGPNSPSPQLTFPAPQPGGQFTDNPYSPPAAFNTHFPGYSYREPHRGAVILALGLISFVVCQLIGIPAVIMGLSDLGKMKQGVMDPSGRGLTIAGLIMGGISVAILVLWMLIFGLAFLANL